MRHRCSPSIAHFADRQPMHSPSVEGRSFITTSGLAQQIDKHPIYFNCMLYSK